MDQKVLLLLCLFALVAGQDAVEEEEVEESTGLSSMGFPGELAFSDGFLRAVGVAGALVTGIAGLAAVLSFLLPMFGLRACAFIGTCDDSATYTPAASSNSVYDQQGFTGYQYGGGFRKRSLEYVGPILKALSSAYEKYGPPAQHRKATAKSATRK